MDSKVHGSRTPKALKRELRIRSPGQSPFGFSSSSISRDNTRTVMTGTKEPFGILHRTNQAVSDDQDQDDDDDDDDEDILSRLEKYTGRVPLSMLLSAVDRLMGMYSTIAPLNQVGWQSLYPTQKRQYDIAQLATWRGFTRPNEDRLAVVEGEVHKEGYTFFNSASMDDYKKQIEDSLLDLKRRVVFESPDAVPSRSPSPPSGKPSSSSPPPPPSLTKASSSSNKASSSSSSSPSSLQPKYHYTISKDKTKDNGEGNNIGRLFMECGRRL